MKRKHKLRYQLKIINRKTDRVIRTLTFTDRETAYNQLNFYNLTLNLRAELTIING